MNMKIESIRALQIYDSRGLPTIEAEVRLTCGAVGRGHAPAGASTGSHEAHELRDGGEAFGGKDVSEAIRLIHGEISPALAGMRADDQQAIDQKMIDLDGTENKSRLGGNALIAVSFAAAEAAANAAKMPLYRWLGGVQANETPCPMMNVLNGGRHAGNNIDIQEFMFVPVGADSFAQAMRMGVECYHALKSILSEMTLETAIGDEGGFAPNLGSDIQAMEFMVRAIERAGRKPGKDVALAIDAAANEWARGDAYYLPRKEEHRTRDELIAHYMHLSKQFPLISIEDPLAEEDFEGFRMLTERLGGEMMIVGDDLFTTNCDRLLRGIEESAANAILIKPNQIGTLTETFSAIRLAREAGYRVILSHRSGDTESAHLADLAVAVGADFLKSGAPARSERLAKYNRMLRIEREMHG
ncbi:MAG: phosphopyruvate hydratase [Clostridia bacterium]|nr:phosphopyruvate hydratase [Clostridia bacterium]